MFFFTFLIKKHLKKYFFKKCGKKDKKMWKKSEKKENKEKKKRKNILEKNRNKVKKSENNEKKDKNKRKRIKEKKDRKSFEINEIKLIFYTIYHYNFFKLKNLKRHWSYLKRF